MLAMENVEPAERRDHMEATLRIITEQLDRLTHQGERVAGDIMALQANMNDMGNRQMEQDRRLGEIREGIAGAGRPAHGADGRGNAVPPPVQPNGVVPGPVDGGNENAPAHGPGGAGDGVPAPAARPVVLKPLRRDDGWRAVRTKKGYYEALPMYGGKPNEWTSFSLKLRIALDEVYDFTASYLIWSSRLTAPLKSPISSSG